MDTAADVKRRACDQCRLRKLACTKEPEGCARCVRENIKCRYSEQKPMGRPRKRHENGEPKQSVWDGNAASPLSAMAHFDGAYQVSPYVDESLLGFGSISNGIPATSTTTVDEGGLPQFILDHGEFGGPINFGDFDASLSIDPSLVSMGVATPAFNNAPETAEQDLPCGCMASIYLAVAGIRELPNEVSPALGTVRSALNTAQSALRCPQCGTFTADPKPSIESFQNVMLLGMLLPTIVDAYKRLLDMIDTETNIATAAGVTKIFKVEDYSGIYDHKRCHCLSLEPCENVTMQPSLWRNGVRSLIRADVYGHAGVSTGLNGLITEMEHRQRTRHRQADILMQAGIVLGCHDGKPMVGTSEKDAVCLRILDNAKKALSTLAIAQ